MGSCIVDIQELSPAKRQEVIEKLRFFLKEDTQAIKLVLELLFVGHLWDDLIDKDKPRTDAEINQAFTFALGEIPTNQYFSAVYPLIRNAIGLWEIANTLENGDMDNKTTAFLIRNALMEVIFFIMYLIGGPAWIAEQGANFWQYFGQGLHKKLLEYYQEVDHA